MPKTISTFRAKLPRLTTLAGFLLFWLLSGQGAFAQILQIDAIVDAMIAGQKDLRQFYIEADAKVYVPKSFISDDPSVMIALEDLEVAENAYSQRILFIRDDYLGIQTSAANGELLHVAHVSKPLSGIRRERHTQKQRQFTDLEIYPPFVFLFSKFRKEYRRLFDFYGINYNRTSYHYGDSNVFYKIGGGNHYALIDNGGFRLEKFVIGLEGQTDGNTLGIEFSAWDSKQTKIPRKVEYYLDDFLIKTLTVKKIQYKGLTAIRNEFDKVWRASAPKNG